MAIFEITKNGIWSKKNSLKLIYLTSQFFLAWTFLNFLAHIVEICVYEWFHDFLYIFLVPCVKTDFRDDSTEDSLENNSDVEVVLDYENFQNGVVEKSNFDDVGVGLKTVSEYYEEMIFSTGKKSIPTAGQKI